MCMCAAHGHYLTGYLLTRGVDCDGLKKSQSGNSYPFFLVDTDSIDSIEILTVREHTYLTQRSITTSNQPNEQYNNKRHGAPHAG